MINHLLGKNNNSLSISELWINVVVILDANLVPKVFNDHFVNNNTRLLSDFSNKQNKNCSRTYDSYIKPTNSTIEFLPILLRNVFSNLGLYKAPKNHWAC